MRINLYYVFNSNKIDENNFYCINRREKAFFINKEIVDYSIRNNLPLSPIKQTFTVYDKDFHSNNS